MVLRDQYPAIYNRRINRVRYIPYDHTWVPTTVPICIFKRHLTADYLKFTKFAGKVSPLVNSLLVCAQMLLSRGRKLALRAAKSLQFVLALHVPLQRALPRGGERAVFAAEHLALVDRQLMILEIGPARRLEGTLGAGVLRGQMHRLHVTLEIQLPFGFEVAELALMVPGDVVGSVVIG